MPFELFRTAGSYAFMALGSCLLIAPGEREEQQRLPYTALGSISVVFGLLLHSGPYRLQGSDMVRQSSLLVGIVGDSFTHSSLQAGRVGFQLFFALASDYVNSSPVPVLIVIGGLFDLLDLGAERSWARSRNPLVGERDANRNDLPAYLINFLAGSFLNMAVILLSLGNATMIAYSVNALHGCPFSLLSRASIGRHLLTVNAGLIANQIVGEFAILLSGGRRAGLQRGAAFALRQIARAFAHTRNWREGLFFLGIDLINGLYVHRPWQTFEKAFPLGFELCAYPRQRPWPLPSLADPQASPPSRELRGSDFAGARRSLGLPTVHVDDVDISPVSPFSSLGIRGPFALTAVVVQARRPSISLTGTQ